MEQQVEQPVEQPVEQRALEQPVRRRDRDGRGHGGVVVGHGRRRSPRDAAEGHGRRHRVVLRVRAVAHRGILVNTTVVRC